MFYFNLLAINLSGNDSQRRNVKIRAVTQIVSK